MSVDPSQDAKGWNARRTALAQWSMKWLVNRTDACGAYTPVDVRETPGNDGKPIPVSYTDKRELTLQRLQAHFSTWAKPEDVIGLHTISLDDDCKVVSIDVDAHASEVSEETRERNRRYVNAKIIQLDQIGLRPLVWETNGKGGYHIDVIFSEPIPAAIAYRLGLWIVRDWQEYGFVSQPESFPKQPSRNGKYGNWLRLIGRHHTRDFWATVYDHDSGEFLSGEAAAMAVLSHPPVSPSAIPAEATVETKEEERRRTRPQREYTASTGDLMKRAAAYLKQIPPAISKQSGHDQTFKAAIAMARFGLPKQDAFDLMSDWNLDCDPPWSDADLWHKIDDAYDKNPEPIGDRPRDSATVNRPAQETPREASQEANCGEAVTIPTTGQVRNFKLVEVDTDDGKKLQPEPIPITAIASKIHELTGGWPARVGGSLFVPNNGHGVAWLDDSDAFGAWLGRATGNPAEFKGMSGFHTKREVFAHHRMNAQEFIAVEELPHEPLMSGHYYACEIPESGSGDRLRELIDRFSPETEIDKDLILALFVTPFYGGKGGTRPAFCLTSDEGRGAGKTQLALCVADVAGGIIEISANEDIGSIKTRLLSPDANSKRLTLLDNVKTHKLSSAEFESLITAPVISGRRMYVGESQRPNTSTFILTMNGAGLSTDMAQRTVTIKLRRPEYSGSWAEDTRRFIQDHRAELVADILGFLRSPAATLEKFSRWGTWEREVLARLPEPSEAQAVIRERQVGVDVDGEESELIEEFFVRQLSELGYSTLTDRVFIPSAVASRWYVWAVGEKMTTARAARALKQRITEGQLRRVVECPNRVNGRGFEFWGDEATGQTYMQTDLNEQIRNRGESHA